MQSKNRDQFWIKWKQSSLLSCKWEPSTIVGDQQNYFSSTFSLAINDCWSDLTLI